MKQKDLALILVIAFVGAVASLLISNAIFTSPKTRTQQEAVVQPITSDFPRPDSHYFNASAFDPTQLITVGQNANSNPFNSTPTN